MPFNTLILLLYLTLIHYNFRLLIVLHISIVDFTFENMKNQVFEIHVITWMFFFIIFICVDASRSFGHSPLEIFNASPYPISLECAEKKYMYGVLRLEYSFSENLSPNTGALLGSPLRQSMNMEMFKNNLFCEFSYNTRNWNCVESFIVEPLCIYENPRAQCKRNKLAGHSEDC